MKLKSWKKYRASFLILSLMLAFSLFIFEFKVQEVKAAPFVNLPSTPVNYVVHRTGSCYLRGTLSNVPPGYDVSNGQYCGWCVNEFIFISPGVTYAAYLYSSYNTSIPSFLQDEDWDKINYLINHKQGDWRDVRDALWYFKNSHDSSEDTGPPYPSRPLAQAMVLDALANGEGFEPAVGQKIAIIVESSRLPGRPSTTVQTTFIEIDLPTQYDLGDAPDSYHTLFATNGANHTIVPGFFLGASVDAEGDGQPTPGADGDDNNGVPDDEDGIEFLTPLIPSGTADINVTASMAGLLDAWIDWDGSGSWEPGEQTFTSQSISAGETKFTINVPAGATPGTTYARFRFSSTGGLPFDGPTSDGEVEDYLVEIGELDFGDALETGTNYPTTLANNGARHAIVPNSMLGTVIDSETNGQPTPGADGDDNNGVPDDEDGVTFDTPLIPGSTAQITITASTAGNLSAWIDWNGDGTWQPGEQIITDFQMTTSPHTFNVPVPSDATPSTTYARFRFSNATGLSPTGLAPDGEVEDYALEIEELDYGDAPDGPYPITFASNGARHVIVQGLNLGSIVDAEVDGQPDGNALGDDNNPSIGPDDEDGVTFTTLSRGQPFTIAVTAAGSGLLNAWIDWNQNGNWDAGEQIFSNEPLNSETKSFTKTVPLDAVVGQTFARFRFDSQGGLSPTGLANDGEVEDYAIPVEEAYDFGDAPDDASHNYKTLLTDGARHRIGEIFMGVTIDDETDGQPSFGAVGDDTDIDGDDEDGVTFPSLPYITGSTGHLTITVSERTNGFISDTNPAYLHGWIDWNQDGDWDDYLENIFCGYQIDAAGTYTIFFPVPGNALPGNTYARFRLDDENLNQITGLAQNGEVEDYLVDPAVSRLPPRQPSSVVGGFHVPVNKLNILAPYLAMMISAILISSIIVLARARFFVH